MLEEVDRTMEADALEVARARSRVLAVVGLEPLPEGWGYTVDLERPACGIERDGNVVLAGPCQLVATWTDDGVWTWGFDDASVPRQGARYASAPSCAATRR